LKKDVGGGSRKRERKVSTTSRWRNGNRVRLLTVEAEMFGFGQQAPIETRRSRQMREKGGVADGPVRWLRHLQSARHQRMTDGAAALKRAQLVVTDLRPSNDVIVSFAYSTETAPDWLAISNAPLAPQFVLPCRDLEMALHLMPFSPRLLYR